MAMLMDMHSQTSKKIIAEKKLKSQYAQIIFSHSGLELGLKMHGVLQSKKIFTLKSKFE